MVGTRSRSEFNFTGKLVSWLSAFIILNFIASLFVTLFLRSVKRHIGMSYPIFLHCLRYRDYPFAVSVTRMIVCSPWSHDWMCVMIHNSLIKFDPQKISFFTSKKWRDKIKRKRNHYLLKLPGLQIEWLYAKLLLLVKKTQAIHSYSTCSLEEM